MSDIIRSLACNSPKKDPVAGKQFVVKACAGGKERIIRFGDKVLAQYKGSDGMQDTHNDKQKKAGFKKRMKCDEVHDKLTSKYWNCNWSWQ